MRIWLLSFESKDTRKVGGLAEVPPRLGEALQSMGHEVYVIVPDHGFLSIGDSVRKYYSVDTVIGSFNYYLYDKPGVKHIVVSGGVLSEPEVYSPRYMVDKVKAWGVAVKYLFEKMVLENSVPDIIHGNDWHSVPSLLAVKTIIYSRKLSTKTFYQIHLLSRARFGLEELTNELGLDENDLLNGYIGVKTVREYYELSRGYLDRLGGLISDKLLTVSRGYVREVVKKTGFDLEKHVDYIPNASPWRTDELLRGVGEKHPVIKKYLSMDKIVGRDRLFIRKYLLTNALEKLSHNEPYIEDSFLREYIYRIDHPPFKGEGRVEPFRGDGPLAIMTGRLSRQKGFHILLRALEYIVYRVPEIKILLMPLPVWSDKDMVEGLVEASIVYRENLRIVFGRAPSIYKLAHLAADAMIAPSLYEPFGLMVLESMASATPVVGSYTGGMIETIRDIMVYGDKGNGLHIKPGDSFDLGEKLSDLIILMNTYYAVGDMKERWFNRISNNLLKQIVSSDEELPYRIRMNCIETAEQYSWKRSAEKALKIYGG